MTNMESLGTAKVRISKFTIKHARETSPLDMELTGEP